MASKWFTIGLAVAVLVIVFSAWGDLRQSLVSQDLAEPAIASGYGRAIVEFSELAVDATIPLTPSLQAKGLAGRTGLGRTEGMLWVYAQQTSPSFWMKDMLISIDIIWISQSQVVDITADIPPPDPGQVDLPFYRASQRVDAVLEVASGFAAEHGILVGDTVSIDRQ